MDLIVQEAKDFAYKAHNGQVRKGGDRPFTDHLESVYSILSSEIQHPNILASAWLHDTVEDTDTEIEDIYKNFGNRVGFYVKLETENKALPWRERKEEQIKHFRMLDSIYNNFRWLPMADKLANLREIKKEYDVIGDEVWDIFNNNNKEDQYWYYSSFRDLVCKNVFIAKSKSIEEYNEILDYIWDKH
ncbi:hypothetical protein BG261_05765 [Floricoccus tropicus]|uniref:HD/PDEase domain-containing protein n=1 Tax=Floricoccus tropicus TaxID=1859473 RepID=A0A1E8GKX5_9LACT|nr:HD domain-containing protein [Floricoccus tropicus]OFI48889.1 hypothetical protein BG261_05765 [Floricoccus tropicus]